MILVMVKKKFAGYGINIPSVNVVLNDPVINPTYVSQSTVSQYTVLNVDATNLRIHYKFDNSSSLFENSAPLSANPVSLTFTAMSSSSDNGIFSTNDKKINNGSLFKSSENQNLGFTITPSNWLYQFFNTNKQATFAFWIKNTEESTPYQHIFRQDQSFIIRQYGNNIQVWVGPDVYRSHDVFTTDQVAFDYNVWTHISVLIDLSTGTSDDDVVKIFKNGVEIPTSPDAYGDDPMYSTQIVGVGFNNDTSTFKFLEHSGGHGFKGYLDDFRIYDKALTATEIGYLANNMVKLAPQPVYEDTTKYKTLTFTYQLQRYPPKTHLKDDTTDLSSSSTSYTHTVSGASYGNGDYIIQASSVDIYVFNSVDKIFSDKTDSGLNRFSFANNNYHNPNDNEVNVYSLGGYDGDWIKVQFPESKVLQKLIIYMDSSLIDRAPAVFKIFGSNNEIVLRLKYIIKQHNYQHQIIYLYLVQV